MDKETKALLSMMKRLIVIFSLLWVTFMFLIGVKMAPNNDMSPKVCAGDILVYYRLDKLPIAQDIVVINKNGTDYIGRVIAAKGDTVEITKEANLLINGNAVIDPNIFYKTPYYEGFVEYPLTLKQDEYFVLVDKREGGEDSRYYGPVKQSEIKGCVIGQFRKNNL